MNWFIEYGHLPAGAEVEIPMFANYQVSIEFEEATGIQLYGYMYIRRSYNGEQYNLYVIPYYDGNYIYINRYTRTNNKGWLPAWRKIPTSDL